MNQVRQKMNDEIIPKLRNDIQLILIEENGHQFVLMTDRNGFANDEIAVSIEFYNLLIELGGKTKYSDISETLKIDELFIVEQIINNIRSLDEMGFLNSSSFVSKRDMLNADYLKLSERPYICAGNSYPEKPDELKLFLNELFSSVDKNKYLSDSKAIIVPHIDLKLRTECHHLYASAYHSAAETDFDLLVILGTAHFADSDYFMLTKKNYQTPLGIIETDVEFIDLWNKNIGDSLTIDEFAHKPEHSVEFQILLSQYFFAYKKFKVLPILVGSFHEFVESKEFPESSERFQNLINSLKQTIEKSGRKPLFAASVDLAHIGKKFGDDFDAESHLDLLKIEDKKLIDSIVKIDKKEFFNKIINDCNKYRICGTSPIYALLSLNEFETSKFLNYNFWSEKETKSAVSFCSVSLR